jgi:hypothetical protein
MRDVAEARTHCDVDDRVVGVVGVKQSSMGTGEALYQYEVREGRSFTRFDDGGNASH